MINAAKEEKKTESTAQSIAVAQRKLQKIGKLHQKLQRELRDLSIFSENLLRKTCVNPQGKLIIDKKKTIISLKKKVDDEDKIVEPYHELQSCLAIKRQTLGGCLQKMKKRSKKYISTINKSNSELS